MKPLGALMLLVLFAGCSSGGTETVVMTRTVEVTTTVQGTTEAPPPASPAVEGAFDPDDVRGPLDLREVVARRYGDLLEIRISTYEPWNAEVLAGPSPVDAGPNRLNLVYDIDEDGESDYLGQVIATEGRLFVAITGTEQAFEPVPAEHRNGTTVTFTHPVDVFFRSPADSTRQIQVAAWSRHKGRMDDAPDSAWIPVPYRR